MNIPFSIALLFASACLYPCIALAQSFPSNSATHVIRQFLVKNMSFDPAKNFTAITQLTRVRGIVGKPPILKHTLMESSCE